MDWNAVVVLEPRALWWCRSLLIAMMVLAAVVTTNWHIRLSMLGYAVWKAFEAQNNPDDLLTFKLALLYLIQVYLFFAVLLGIGRYRRLRESHDSLVAGER